MKKVKDTVYYHKVYKQCWALLETGRLTAEWRFQVMIIKSQVLVWFKTERVYYSQDQIDHLLIQAAGHLKKIG